MQPKVQTTFATEKLVFTSEKSPTSQIGKRAQFLIGKDEVNLEGAMTTHQGNVGRTCRVRRTRLSFNEAMTFRSWKLGFNQLFPNRRGLLQ